MRPTKATHTRSRILLVVLDHTHCSVDTRRILLRYLRVLYGRYRNTESYRERVASPPPAGSPGALLPSDDVAAAAVVGEDETEGEDDLVGDDEEIDEEEVDGEQGDGEDENGGENAQFRVSKFYVAPIPAFRS